MTDLASAAFRLALRGKAVFRLAPGSKEPMAGSHGHLDATTECDVARTWWVKEPNANIAMAHDSRIGTRNPPSLRVRRQPGVTYRLGCW